jgi:hypothetical protein
MCERSKNLVARSTKNFSKSSAGFLAGYSKTQLSQIDYHLIMFTMPRLSHGT